MALLQGSCQVIGRHHISELALSIGLPAVVCAWLLPHQVIKPAVEERRIEVMSHDKYVREGSQLL
jgi:hypothetical protein